MPAPLVYTYSAAALVAAHTSFRDLVDSGAGPGLIRVRSNLDVLLAEIELDDPCGVVNGTTGKLTLAISGPDLSANASGTAGYVEICDSLGTAYLSLPVQTGTVAVSGVAVLNSLTIVAGAPVNVVSAVIG